MCICVVQDLKGSVARIAQFLEKPLDAEVIEKITDRCLFKNMKQNKMSNYSTVPQEAMDQTKTKFHRKGDIQYMKHVVMKCVFSVFRCALSK